MKAMVIYDSIFGNTEQIAQAVVQALGSQNDVQLLKVNMVRPKKLTEANILIVGSPTRGFRATPAINKLLKSIPKDALKGIQVAAFDTGIALNDIDSAIGRLFIRLFGYAAKPILTKLEKKGGKPVVPPTGFFVEGIEGPLKTGELERAVKWALQIFSQK